jgi:hypothetical protein
MKEVTRYITVNNKEFNSKHGAVLEELSLVKEIMETAGKNRAMACPEDCPLREICDEIIEDTHKDLCLYFA